MSERQETVDDIIAEMRIFKCCNLETGELELCSAIANYFADRLEAAYKREKAAIEADALAVGGDCRSGAEARARRLRETMRAIWKEAKTQYWNDNGIDLEWLMAKAQSALDAPPRNCDVGSVDEQAQRFYNFCTEHSSAIQGMCDCKCPCIDSGDKCHCLCKWAQMPYEEGGAE